MHIPRYTEKVLQHGSPQRTDFDDAHGRFSVYLPTAPPCGNIKLILGQTLLHIVKSFLPQAPLPHDLT